MSTPSLTKQSAILIAGRVFSMPLAFLVPVVLTRLFSVEEFGYYKQLFLVFNVLLPFLDFGVTNSLYYFIPRYPHLKSSFIGQTILLSLALCASALCIYFIFPGSISRIFTNNDQIAKYVFLLGVFTVTWHLSNLLEVILIVEKKVVGAGVVTFLSRSRKVACIDYSCGLWTRAHGTVISFSASGGREMLADDLLSLKELRD